MTTYTIRRMHFDTSYSRDLESGLTLEEAQEHCRDSETSSKTACDETLEKEAALSGGSRQWFDGYNED